MPFFARHRGIGWLLVLIGSWTATVAAAGSKSPAPTLSLAETGYTDRVIVHWKSSANGQGKAQRTDALTQFARGTGHMLSRVRDDGNGATILALPNKQSPADIARLAAQLRAHGEVAQVVPDRLFFPQATPTDPLFSSQWHLGATSGINMPGAWDITTGSSNVIVAVVDTGKLPHNDLSGRFIGGYDFVSVPARQNDGTPCSTTPNDPNCRDADPTDPGDWVTMAESTTVGGPLFGCPVTDSRWHGTAMAGIIAANSNAQGIAGINWNSKILPVRVVGKCGGYESDIADGIRWAAGLSVPGVADNPNIAAVINVSLAAAGSCSATLQSALDAVAASNITVVVSAGNQGTNASGYSPGNCNNVIAVGAVDRNGGKPAYSNFGTTLALSAPGGIDGADNAATNILTTHNTGLTTASSNNDTTKAVFGTSPAAAQVSGVVSLLLSAYPSYTPGLIKEVLQNTRRAFPSGTTTIMPNPSQADCNPANCGAGILNASNALQAASKWIDAPAAITGGNFAVIALNTTGRLATWGQGNYAAYGASTLLTAPFPASQLSGLQRISQYSNHSLALRADGSVWAWGGNESGQLGDGTTTLQMSPVRVAGALLSTPIREVAAGTQFSLALDTNGIVWSWGLNTTGQLGDGTFAPRQLPAQVAGLSNVVAIAAGQNLAAAVKADGSVWRWGRNITTPAQVMGLPANAVGVALGQQHAIYLMGNGTVWAEGANNQGLLGTGVFVVNAGAPPAQVLGLTGITRIAAHNAHSLALDASGRVWAWGTNGSGQLGDGTTVPRNTPVQVERISSAVAIGLGPVNSFAIKADGSVWAWGGSSNAALGLGVAGGNNETTPVQVFGYGGFGTLDLGVADRTKFAAQTDVPASSQRTSNSIRVTGITNGAVISVDAGAYSVGCNGTFISTPSTINNNQFLCLRQNAPGSCGMTGVANVAIAGLAAKPFSVSTAACDSTPDNFEFFPFVAMPSQVVTSNAVTLSGINTTAPISIVGGTYSIGCGASFTAAAGTINNGQTVCVKVTAPASPDSVVTSTLTVGTLSKPFHVMTTWAPMVTFPTAIAANRNQTFATKTNGLLYAWGAPAYIGVGGSTSILAPFPPTQIPTIAGVRKISTQWAHTLALRANGELWSWGTNDFGELGDGQFFSRDVPGRVAGALLGQNVISASAGRNFSLAVRSDNTVWAWGNNDYGQLGDGTHEPRLQPTQVTGLTNVIEVAAGLTRSLALKSDGTVWQWGTEGGNESPVPVQITGLPFISSIASGHYHGLFIGSNGQVYVRGINSAGQLGDGTQNQNFGTPQQVPGISNAVAAAAGIDHSVVLLSDNTLMIWGGNAYGQLGDGTTLNRLSPIPVAGITAVRAIAAGEGHTAIAKLDGSVYAWGRNYSGELGIASAPGIGVIQVTPAQTVAGAAGLDLGPLGPLVFASQTDVPLSSVRTSNSIVLTGLPAGAISVTNGSYSIGCNGTFTSAAGMFTTNAVVCVRQTSSAACATKTTTTLTASGAPFLFEVTTAACDTTPDPFSFIPKADVAPGSIQTSNTVTISGLVGSVPISVTGGSYSIGCTASFTPNPSTISNGQTVCVRQTASASADALSVALLTIGSTSAPFEVMTKAATSFTATPQIAADQSHGLGLRSDGKLFAWGDGAMLGAPGLVSSQIPVAVTSLSGVKRIAQGGQLAVALRSDGSVWTWGSNTSGQLGDGTTTGRAYPGRVQGALATSNLVDVAAGTSFALALRDDGTVWAWGSNDNGQLGDGSTIARTLPVRVGTLTGIVAIAAGGSSAFAVNAMGNVWGWGGVNTSTSPQPIAGLPAIAAVATGGAHHLYLTTTGTVWSAGANHAGQLGDGTFTPRASPVAVPGLANVTRVAAGQAHSVALKSDGSVLTWGNNGSGQLGDGSRFAKPAPVNALGMDSVLTIAAGFSQTYAIHADGMAFAWGDNALGQLGTGVPATGSAQPMFVVQPVPTLVQNTSGGIGSQLILQLRDAFPDAFAFLPAFGVAPGATVTSAPVTIAGFASPAAPMTSIPVSITGGTFSVAGGPFATSGMIQNGQTVQVRVQAPASLNTTASATLTAGAMPGRSATFYVRTRRDPSTGIPVPQVVAGTDHSAMLSPDGVVFGVGYNSNGQLGNGSAFSSPTLRATSGLSDVTAIASGGNHMLALRQDRTVVAWGYNGSGQLGNNTTGNSQPVFVPVAVAPNIVAISAGEFHSLALADNGEVWAWGLSSDGQAGTGSATTPRYLVPQKVSGITSAIAIAAGGKHNLALLANGSVVAWGANASGQLGNGGTASAATPVNVTGLGSGVSAIAAGGAHSLAIKADGTLVAWGDNAFGQLGDGTLSNRNTPVAVTVLGNRIARIAAGANHSLALKSGGALYTWGANANSQLGDGTTTNRSTPFLVTSRPNMVAIGGGARHSGGINTRGELFLWGDNYFGQVGNKSGNFNPNSTALNVLRGDSEISTGAPPVGSSAGTTSTSGSAVIEIALVATGYEFPAQTVGTPTAVSGKFKNQALTQDITGISVSVTGSGFSIASNACNSNLSAGSECDFSIQFQPGTAGDAYGELQVSSSLEGSPERRSLYGTGIAAASPAIKVTATAGDAYVIFAPQDVGTTSAAANVTIANTGAAPLVISNIATASGGPDFTAGTNCVTTLSPGANCTVPVAFSPTLAASLTDELTITSNAGTAKVTLSGSGASDGTAPTISLLSVVSRKTHGTAGPLDIIIDRTKSISQAYTVEPRAVGTGHKLIFTFNSTLSSAGTITLLNASNQPLTGIGVTSSFAGSALTLNLTNVPDAQRMTIQLANLNGSGSASVAMGFLVGDVTNSRMVTAADIATVKSRSSQMATSANARYDINLSGDISSADITAAKSRAGASIP